MLWEKVKKYPGNTLCIHECYMAFVGRHTWSVYYLEALFMPVLVHGFEEESVGDPPVAGGAEEGVRGGGGRRRPSVCGRDRHSRVRHHRLGRGT